MIQAARSAIFKDLEGNLKEKNQLNFSEQIF
jgi:hypothetical protein